MRRGFLGKTLLLMLWWWREEKGGVGNLDCQFSRPRARRGFFGFSEGRGQLHPLIPSFERERERENGDMYLKGEGGWR